MTTLLTTPFTWESTAAEVIDGVDLTGKRAIVTGAASGIGVETARALASAGAHVTLAVRDLDAGRRTAGDIAQTTGRDDVDVRPLELADRASIDAFADGWTEPLHILVNNAGVMAIPERRLDDHGNEMQFAVNHLGHFRLALGLHDALVRAEGARVVSLSSVGHRRAGVDFDDLAFERREYHPMVAYGQSKTANVLFAVEADRLWHDDGIRVNAVHPGAILDGSKLAQYRDPEEIQGLVDSGRYRFKTQQQGAATSVLVAASPLTEGVGGRYFEDVNEAHVVGPDPAEGDWSGVASFALDSGTATRLWEVSLTR